MRGCAVLRFVSNLGDFVVGFGALNAKAVVSSSEAHQHGGPLHVELRTKI